MPFHLPPLARRIAAAQVATNLFGGVYLAYYAVWLKSRGFSSEAIGFMFASANILRVFTSPVAGIISDASDDRRSVVFILASASLIAWLCAGASDVLFLTAAFAVLGVILHAGIGPVIESVTIRQARLHGFEYGRVRLIGSLSFVVATFFSGVFVQAFGVGAILPMFFGVLALTIGAAFVLPGAIAAGSQKRALTTAMASTLREAGVLISRPIFLLFLAAVSFAQASHAFYYGFFTLSLEAQGYRGEAIGALWGLGVLAEVVLFYFARHTVERVGAVNLLLIGVTGGALRWALTAFSPPAPIFILIQLMHAFSFGAVHLGAMYFIVHTVPVRLASTAQSLYAITAFGLFTGFGGIISGFLFARVGELGYLAMAGFSLAGIGLTLWLREAWDGAPLLAEEDVPPPSALGAIEIKQETSPSSPEARKIDQI
ncbi:MAG: MFS transporter [Alphaproteobacteria bacterium]|nr:MFS transporter [Alphaproteobacteria bacterium]